MGSIYDEKALTKLEQEEHHLTEVALIAIFAWLYSTKSNLENELRQFYQKYGKDGVVTYSEVRKWVSEKNHKRRLTWLLALISTQFTLLFSKPVTKLSVTVSGISAITTPGSCELEWNVVLTGIKPGKYSVSVIADNHLLDLPNIEIKSALSGGNGDLP